MATFCSNLIATLYFLVIILMNRGRTVVNLRPTRKALCFSIPQDVLAIGLPACLMTLFENISYAVLDSLMALSGTVMQAGIGVAKKINMFAHCMVDVYKRQSVHSAFSNSIQFGAAGRDKPGGSGKVISPYRR